MAGFNYSSLQNTADTLIKRFGDTAFITQYVDTPAPNPWEPPVRTEVTIQVQAVFIKAKEQHADGVLIHIGDQIALVSGKVDQPNLNGDLTRGLEKWKIEAIVPIKPGPINMLYKVKLAK